MNTIWANGAILLAYTVDGASFLFIYFAVTVFAPDRSECFSS